MFWKALLSLTSIANSNFILSENYHLERHHKSSLRDIALNRHTTITAKLTQYGAKDNCPTGGDIDKPFSLILLSSLPNFIYLNS